MHIHRIIGSIIGTTIPTLCRVSLISNNEKKQKETASLAGERLAISIKKKCTIEQQENGMEIRKLKLKELSTYSDSKASSFKRFSLGKRNPMECQTSKTILLMGETGAGKTTMINAMINYVLGVEWEDDFRFKLVDEKIRGGSQAHSQTQVITAYDIHHQEGFRIPFSLTIVDTPGFDSTDGLDFDKEIPKAIENFFKDENGIRELDVVCFVVKSPDERLTNLKKYIFDSVLSIFGIDIKENIRFLTTFADNELPLILTAIIKAELPCQMDAKGLPCHQKFNNGAIYSNNQDDKDSISPMNLWKDGMKNFKLFFDELSDMPTKSLQMTQEVLLTRRCLEIQLDHGLKDINSQLYKAGHLRTVEGIIAQNKDKFNTNGDKKIEIPVLKKRIVAVDEESALNCTKCKVTCHYPCKPIPWMKPFCPAFIETRQIKSIIHKIFQYGSSTSWISLVVDAVSSLSSVTCLVCPGKCSMSDHKNENTRWEEFEENTLMTLRDIGKDYKDAEGNPLSVQGIRDKLKDDIDKLEKNILEAMSEITKCSNTLKEIALRKDPLLTMPEYIDMMIKNEKKYPTPEYEKRIDSLENILKKAKLYAGAETKTTFEWESSTNPNDFHSFIY